jgi:hypothetical protein
MECPQCGGEMWDNRGKKKNPKQPDFRCKDEACAKAVWLSKKTTAPATSGGYKGKTGTGDTVPKSMYGAWAMNLVIAMLHDKLIKAADVKKIFAQSVAMVGEVLNGVPTKPVAKPAPVQQEEPTEEQTGEEPENTLEDISI